jgi:hypothetical protein
LNLVEKITGLRYNTEERFLTIIVFDIMLKEGCKMEVQKVNVDDKQRILILEDDEDLAEGISLSLNSNELDFTLCKTIAEAKSILQQKAFDLLW